MSAARVPQRRLARLAMGGSVTASLVVLAVLLAAGWERDAWIVAASALLLSCLLACLATVLADRRSSAEVDRAVERLRAGRGNPARPR